MTIRVSCGACHSSFSVADKHSGKKAKCRHCGGTIVVPAVKTGLGSPDVALPPAAAVQNRASEQTIRQIDPQTAFIDTDLTAATFEQSPDSETRPITEAPLKRSRGSQERVNRPSDPSQMMREILGGFEGDFPRVIPSLPYRFAALVVTGVMVILPLIYVALIGLFAYSLYWHATENFAIVSGVRGIRAGKAVLLIYFAPLIVGAILILFMVKPLFARSPKQPLELQLSFVEEPLLHSFVQRLCLAVNAKPPSLIEVDCEANAGAFFRNGWSGFLRNDMGLRIGLPLLAALDTRQLAGVLAHEFGHFSQGAGMRLSYIIRSINHWFARVVYERDEWDEQLDSWMDEGGWVTVISALAKLFVWLTRWILWLLMIFGNLVGSVLLRQMEYDADKYETRLAGSDVFESTTRRLIELNLADLRMQHLIAGNYESVGIPDDLPFCLSRIARTLPPETSQFVDHLIENSETSLFASHPSDRDRIAAARKQNAAGIFRLEKSAKALLRDFRATAKRATMLFYQRRVGKTAATKRMVPTTEFLSKIEFDISHMES